MSTQNIEQIFIANSSYSLYQYLVLFPDKFFSTLFICGPAIQHSNLPNKMILDCRDDKTGSEQKRYLRIIMSKLKHVTKGRSVPCYANLVTPFATDLISVYPTYVLSDGLGDSVLFPKWMKDSRIKMCYATRLGNDWEKDVSKKLIVTDLKQKWNEKSKEEQNVIAHAFNVEPQLLLSLNQKKVILVTQPLSEDGIVSEKDKIRLYQSILSQYNQKDVVIKPHPRETTDWGRLYPDIPIIPRQIAAELLTSLINPEKVCTFFSTAVFQMATPDKIDIYAKDFSRLTFSHPGQKMGRVAYVDIEKTYGHMPFNWKVIPDTYFYRSCLDNRNRSESHLFSF